MKGKITLLAGAAVGYVLGARAGRERYETIKTQAGQAAEKVRQDPRVQEKAAQAQDLAKEKAAEATQAVKDKVGGSDGGSDGASSTSTPGPGTTSAAGTTGTTGTGTTGGTGA